MPVRERNFMVYGANGYTGRLIVEMAVERGLKPVIAGRNAKKIKDLAKRFDLPYEVFELTDKEALSDAVLGVNVVLHCAGPFVNTVKPMLEACLRNGTHYLDITGEMAVFEKLAHNDMAFKTAKIMVMPGTGFDVVPTDCLAAYLKAQLPSATHLTLAFRGSGGLSHGTATTMLQNINKGGAVRKNGKIIKVPPAYKTRKILFKRKANLAVTIPWGDISTAYHSTGIPNIEVYMATTPFAVRMLKATERFGWLLKRNFVRNFLQARIDARPAGPSAETRRRSKSYVWGEVSDELGNQAVARLVTPEGYTLTALAALTIVQKVLKGNAPIGFQTPSSAYGADLILEIPGVTREDIAMRRNIAIS
jgi:short subunit dehydrogenase-like uncharacterized protein